MFNWLFKKIQDTRIDFSYPAYEATEKSKHVALANSRFCVRKLQTEIDTVMSIPRQEAFVLYQGPITKLSQSISKLSTELSEQRVNRAIFSRSYKTELDPLYELSHELKAKLDELHSDKDDAYDDLNSAKQDIDHWYSKSKRTVFFGNGGKELPKHSLFGQSHGDLDAYKYDRDKASEEIQSCNQEIGRIKAKKTILYAKINTIKADRQRMQDLRKKGLNIEKIKNILINTEKQLSHLQAELKQLEAQRVMFFESARQRNGVGILEAEIVSIESEKKAFLCSFDQIRAKSGRKLAHRKEWFNTH